MIRLPVAEIINLRIKRERESDIFCYTYKVYTYFSFSSMGFGYPVPVSRYHSTEGRGWPDTRTWNEAGSPGYGMNWSSGLDSNRGGSGETQTLRKREMVPLDFTCVNAGLCM